MKNILIISQYFWPDNFLINDFSQILKKNEYNVSIVTGSSGYYVNSKDLKHQRKVSNHDYKIIQLPTFSRGGFIGLFFNYISFIISGIFFLPFKLYSKKFDLVLVYATSPVTQIILGYYVKIIKNCKLVIWVQDLWPELLKNYFEKKYYSYIAPVLKKIINTILKKSDLIFCQSEGYLQHYNEEIPNIKNKLKILPNFSNEYQIKQKIVKNQNLKLLFTGNIGKSQNIDLLIDVAEELQKSHEDIFIYFYGDGSEKDKLLKSVKLKKINNIIVKDHVNSKEIIEIINHEADAVLLTLEDNYGLNLTIPSRLQTFLYIGKPVIASINGEAQKIINAAKCGICVDANDKAGLIKAIVDFKAKKEVDLIDYQKNAINFYENNFSKKQVLSIWKKELKF